jgi:hypothetical protein
MGRSNETGDFGMQHSETLNVGCARLGMDFDCEVEYDCYSNNAQDRAEGLGSHSLDESSIKIANIQDLWLEYVESSRGEVEVKGEGVHAVITLPEQTTRTRHWREELLTLEDFEGYLHAAVVDSLTDWKW